MIQSTLTHIVPALPPQIDGVGDYALNLARRLRDQHGLNARFIVCDPAWDGPSRIEDFVVRRLRLRSEAGIWALLASAKDNPTVLLHYVGYGYQKRGVPFWLYKGVKSWLAERSGGSAATPKRLSTVFHELWASSAKPWKSAFYLRPMQKWLVGGFHRRSEVSVTSTRGMQAILERIQPRKSLWLPIPSNIPALNRSRPNRPPNGKLRVAIFGQPWSRSATVSAHANLLGTLDRNNLLGCAVLLGKSRNPSDPRTDDLALLRKCVARQRIEVLGELSPQEVSRALGQSDLFLSPYRGELACKSGAFMAALAAGCPAVLRDGENSAPLREGEHFLASDDTDSSVQRLAAMTMSNELPRIAASARTWYELNADWKVIARRYQEVLGSAAQPVEAPQVLTFSEKLRFIAGGSKLPLRARKI